MSIRERGVPYLLGLFLLVLLPSFIITLSRDLDLMPGWKMGDVHEPERRPHDVPSGEAHAILPLRIVTYNVRYATQRPFKGEELWKVRYPKLTNQLNFITSGHESSFICLQECLHQQVHDVQKSLGDRWSHVGRGRGEKPEDGEFSPIFFRSDTWTCVRNETRWLSKTPSRPSRGWDANLNRIATLGEFEHIVTGTRAVVLSTHFDDGGRNARLHSARLILEFAREWSESGLGRPPSVVLVGGDFNSPEDDPAYQEMTAPGSGMSDIRDLVPKEQRYGNEHTYTSFAGEEPSSRIDFLFIQQPLSARVNTFGVLSNSFDDKLMLSDHRPVVADLDVRVG